MVPDNRLDRDPVVTNNGSAMVQIIERPGPDTAARWSRALEILLEAGLTTGDDEA